VLLAVPLYLVGYAGIEEEVMVKVTRLLVVEDQDRRVDRSLDLGYLILVRVVLLGLVRFVLLGLVMARLWLYLWMN
jgi:hypothetical protein